MKPYTFWGNWWPDNIPSKRWEKRRWLEIRWGCWKELHEWPIPGRIFQWSGFLPDLWYYLKCRFWRHYNRVEIPTLRPTWNEWDERILHAAFTLLVDFIEKDNGGQWSAEDIRKELAKPDQDEMHTYWATDALPRAVEQEALYAWWKHGRQIRLDAEDAALTAWHDAFTAAGGMTFGESDGCTRELKLAHSEESERLAEIREQLEIDGDKEDEEMLIRLIKIRLNLWS